MSVIEVIELILPEGILEDDSWWDASGFGRGVFGSSKNRPWQVLGNKAMYVSIVDPIYGPGFQIGTGGSGAIGISTISAGAVTGITVTAGGTGYTGAAVTLSGGGGSGATATATITSGVVTAVTITAGGTGYTSSPTVSFAAAAALTIVAGSTGSGKSMTGNVQAKELWYREISNERGNPGEATAVIDLGGTPRDVLVSSNALVPDTELFVSHREFYIKYVDKLGAYYIGARIPYSGGSGATATAAVSGQVTAANVTAAGTGYTSATVAFSGGGGSGAAANAIISNVVSSVSVTAAGSGYTSATASFSGGGGSGASASVSVLGGVSAGTVVNKGSGYTAATVGFSGGGGSGATATAAVTSGVGSVAVTAPGSGYSNAFVAFSGGGGSGAAASVSITGGVSSVTVPFHHGSGWTSPPTVIISGGGGSGATATATISGTNGYITSVTVTNAGSGYTSDPTVTFSGSGNADPLTATRSGTVTSITVTNSGSGYSGTPTVAITGVGGSGATGTASMTGVVSSITITAAGSGYTSAPTLTIYGDGTGATGTASLSGTVTGVTVISGGIGYTSAPTVTISGNGTGATATASISSSGQIASIVITANGSGYTSTPTLTISGTGTGATGTATVTYVSTGGFTITNGGSGYLTAPQVLLYGGSGSGATAVATITGGVVTAITIANAGTGYTTPPIVYFDTALIDVSSSKITLNRPLESGLECSVFPAVSTAAVTNQRLNGAVLTPRTFMSGAVVTLTNGSNLATIIGDVWRQADTYKGIVDYSTNQIFAFVQRVISPTTARVLFPGTLDTTWPYPTTSYIKAGMSGDQSMIYYTPIYVGEAAGGLTYGFVTFDPLNQLRNDDLYGAGAAITKICRQNEDLLVVYDSGIAVYQGETQTGQPSYRQFLLAEHVGALNPEGFWQDYHGFLWFQGHGRIWRTNTSSGVEDIALSTRNASLWDRFVQSGVNLIFQSAYNPQRNTVLMIGLGKNGDDTAGRYAMMICHDANTFNAIRFPVAMTAEHCMQHTDGTYHYYGSSGDWVYELLKPGKVADDYRDTENVLHENVKIDAFRLHGVDWFGSDFIPESLRFLIETDSTNMALTVSIMPRFGNLIGATFNPPADLVKTLDYENLSTVPAYPLPREMARGFQFKISVSSDYYYRLITMTLSGQDIPIRMLN